MHPNQVFSAEEIFETVWNQESIIRQDGDYMSAIYKDKIEAATEGWTCHSDRMGSRL